MNKPVTFICACITGLGMVILARSTFLTVVYGHGNMEAGNFNRCWYSATRDPQTGQLVREWDVGGESTEHSIVDRLNMWAVGVAFVAAGAAIYVGEWASRRPRHEF
jgi:hypothetical protein